MLSTQLVTLPKRVTVYDVNKNIRERQEKKTEAFETILDQIHKKIQLAADKQILHFNYTVPTVVLGYPLYDYKVCLAYLIYELRGSGFKVRHYAPDVLYISMDLQEIKRDKLAADNARKTTESGAVTQKHHQTQTAVAPPVNPLQSVATKPPPQSYHPIVYSQPKLPTPIHFSAMPVYNPEIPMAPTQPFTQFDPIASVYQHRRETHVARAVKEHPYKDIVTRPDGKRVLKFN